jgi:putative ABC transport system substrate-binding protein
MDKTFWRCSRSETNLKSKIQNQKWVGILAIILSLVAWVGMAEAQQPKKIPRIGFLSPQSPSDPRIQRFREAFRQDLRELGWVEGKNIVIEYRWAEGKTERLADLAAQLLSLKVDVIVAATTPAIQAAKQATGTIPIVMAVAVDPVATGFVASIARPGGNITGLSMMATDLVGNQMQLLKELLPKISRVALLWNPTNPSNAPQFRQAQDEARAFGLRLQSLEARDPSEIDSAFAAMTRERAGAVIVLADTMFVDHRTRIADLSAKSRLPAVYGLTDHAEAGGLMVYGANVADMYRRAATYVDKILKGAKTADLPVEQPTKFEFVINLKAAKQIGLMIPQSVLFRADRVIK